MALEKYQNFIYKSIFTSPERNDTGIDAKATSLYKHHKDRHFIILKSYSINELPFLRHWYLAYNNIEWHPGTPNSAVYVTPNSHGCGEIEKIYEYCTLCADDMFKQKIESDKQFYLPFYNCDTMLGNCVETCMILISLVSLCCSLLLKSIIAFILFIICTITLLTANKFLHRSPTYEVCKHIDLSI